MIWKCEPLTPAERLLLADLEDKRRYQRIYWVTIISAFVLGLAVGWGLSFVPGIFLR